MDGFRPPHPAPLTLKALLDYAQSPRLVPAATFSYIVSAAAGGGLERICIELLETKVKKTRFWVIHSAASEFESREGTKLIKYAADSQRFWFLATSGWRMEACLRCFWCPNTCECRSDRAESCLRGF